MRFISGSKNDQSILARIRQGDESASQQLYNRYANVFINWAKKTYSGLDTETAVDVWQEAFLAFYVQVRDGKIQKIKTSIKALLFAIGRNKIRDNFKKQGRIVPLEGSSPQKELTSIEADQELTDNDQRENNKALVDRLLKVIGEPCKTVLELAFFRNYAPESIARAMGYTNEATARVRKTRCLKQLGDLLLEMNIQNDQFF